MFDDDKLQDTVEEIIEEEESEEAALSFGGLDDMFSLDQEAPAL